MAFAADAVILLVDIADEVAEGIAIEQAVTEAVQTQIAIAEDAQLGVEETEFTAMRAGLREGYATIAESGSMDTAGNFADAVEEATGVKPDMDPGNFDSTYEDTEPEDDNCAEFKFRMGFTSGTGTGTGRITHLQKRQISKAYKRWWLAARNAAIAQGLPPPKFGDCSKESSPDKAEVKEGSPQDHDPDVQCSEDPLGPGCENAKADNAQKLFDSMNDDELPEDEDEDDNCPLNGDALFKRRLKYDIKTPEFKEWRIKRKYTKIHGLALPIDPPQPNGCDKPDPEKKPTLRQRIMRIIKWVVGLAILVGGFGVGIWQAILHFLVAQVAGPVLEWWCRMNGGCGPGDKCGLCTKNSSGTCDPACQKYNCDVNQYCQSKTCDSVKKFLNMLRKYAVEIALVYLILSIILVLVFKSFNLVLFLLVIAAVLYILSGIMGNWIATMVCNETAYDCYEKTGSVHC